MSSSQPKYRLSSALIGHGSDVRALSTPSSSTLFSSSRDRTARAWRRSDDRGWDIGPVFAVSGGQQGYVNAVLGVTVGDSDQASGEAEPTHVLTGGQDAIIYVFAISDWLAAQASTTSDLKPITELAGHAGNICAFSAAPGGKVIVSGSWDNSAIVWRDFSYAYQLDGHKMAVWAVLAAPVPSAIAGEELVLTGSADQSIKLWKGKNDKRTFNGHTGPVRALAWLGGLGVGASSEADRFASAANDATVRIWTLAGETVGVLDGHTSFVYSLAVIPPIDGRPAGLVSSGEDRSVRVWNESGALEQTIFLPAISVWAVSALPNGDIAAATNDAVIRVFTRDPARLASEADLAEFDEKVQGQTLNQTQVGDVKKTDLPGPERLQQPGTKQDQVIMVKNQAGGVEAHQWTGLEWQKVGDVVDAVGQGRKQLYQGKEYDYVFDVDIKDGAPPLKLPYNVNENPYKTAQKFLHDNDLPQTYLDQVVSFIDQNTQGAQLGSNHHDPYTGASSYRPDQNTSSAPSAGTYSGDPWTGGGRSAAPAASSSILPHRNFLSFTDGNVAAIQGKLEQFNTELSGSTEAVDASDIATLFKLAGKAKSSAAVEISSEQQGQVSQLLSWPAAKRFPALDLIRLLAIVAPLPNSLPALLDSVRGTTAASSAERERNSMLALRAVANAIANVKGREAVKANADEIVTAVTAAASFGLNKNGKVAAATVVLNLSILAVKRELPAAQAVRLLDVTVQLLQDTDSEAVYRSLVAFGNIRSSDVAGQLAVGKVQEGLTASKAAQSRLAEERVNAVVSEIEKL